MCGSRGGDERHCIGSGQVEKKIERIDCVGGLVGRRGERKSGFVKGDVTRDDDPTSERV
jgi:hypothetical protein